MAKMIDNEMVVFFDVDDTLLMWENHNHWIDKPGKKEIVCPYSNATSFLIPHKDHIDLLIKYKARGYVVIVWSAGGCRWAQAAVDVLHLNDYVDFTMSKPLKYVDDLPAKEILGERVYIPYGRPGREIIPGESE